MSPISETTFLTFKAFNEKSIAEDFSNVLEENGIEFLIEEDALIFDPSYANNPLNKEYLVKIKQTDFIKAGKAYENYFQVYLDQVPGDYYLFEFSDKELLDIIQKPDEWGSLDYMLAKKLLSEKGIIITTGEAESIRSTRLKELSAPSSETGSTIFFAYIICIILFPLGLILGWIWGYSKKKLPNGDKVFSYSISVRNHGRNIFLLGWIVGAFVIIWKVSGSTQIL